MSAASLVESDSLHRQRLLLHCHVVHVVPHAPQLVGSVRVSTQLPPQSVRPGPHEHVPETHAAVAGHLIPHAPQLRLSELTSTQRPPHDVVGGMHAHCPALQAADGGQIVPQPPQCKTLDPRSTQLPPHFVAGPHPAEHAPCRQT